jgi:hypothetical protein
VSEVLTAHRQRIAGALRALGAFSAVFILAVLISTSDGVDEPMRWTSLHDLLFVAQLAGVLIFTALVFGGWKIAWFVLRNPRVVRSDWVYIAIFSVWIAYMLGTGIVLTLRR